MLNCEIKKEVEVKVPDRTIRQDNPGYRVFSRLGVEEVGALRLRSVEWDYLIMAL